MNDHELRTKLAETGIRQFVRNVMTNELITLVDNNLDPDKMMQRMNETLESEFRRIARDESNKVWAELKAKLDIK
jgi:hypothetical protein